MLSKRVLSRYLVILLSPVSISVMAFLLSFVNIDKCFSQPIEEVKRIAEEKKKEKLQKEKAQKENIQKLYQDAVSYYEKKKYSKAKELFEKVRDSKIDLGFFENIKLRSYLKRIDKDIEEQNRKRAELRGIYDEGKKLLNAGDYKGARKKFRNVLASGIELGNGLDEELSNNLSKAEQKLEESRRAARNRGRAAREAARKGVGKRAGRLEEAEGLLERLKEESKIQLKKNLKEAEMLYQVGKKLYVERDYVKALGKLEDALRKNPNHIEARRLANEVRGILGIELYKPKMLQERLENEKEVKIASDMVQIGNSLQESKTLISRAKYEEAIKKLERAQRKLGFLELHTDVSAYKSIVADMIKDAKAKRAEQIRQEKAERQRIALDEAAKEQKRLEQLEEDKIDKLFQKVVMKFQQEEYDEAVRAAKDILQIQPDNGPAKEMIDAAKREKLRKRVNDLEKEDENRYQTFKQDLKESAIPQNKDVKYPDPETWRKIKQRRPVALPSEVEQEKMMEEELQSALQKKVGCNFNNTPLPDALRVLGDEAGTNLIVSHEAAEIGMSHLVNFQTLPERKITLQSAIETILPKEMSYILKDEAIRVDLRDRIKADQELIFRAYDVTDLLLVTDDYGSPDPRVKIKLVSESGPGSLATPVLESMPQATDSPTGPLNSKSPSMRHGSNDIIEKARKRSLLDNDTIKKRGKELVDLIIKMTGRENWKSCAIYSEEQDSYLPLEGKGNQEFGGTTQQEEKEFGPGTVGIKGGDLLVQQTAQLHESIEEILKGLRGARYIQVSVQARFLTVSDNFIEEIGTTIPSFSSLFGENPGTANSILASPGLGTPTALPLVGTATATAADLAGGEGLNMLFSFIGNTQLDAIMRLAQTSDQAKVLSAPRITCFNAQRASLIIGTQTNFVLTFTSTGLGTTGGATVGGTALVPQIAVAPNSIGLDVRPIVSADRRYVYLELQPAISQLESLRNFPITTFIPFTNPLGGTTFISQDIPVQLPTISSRGVGTTVCVPDRGTVLFGGLATYTESDSESGPPIISKIPVINFFFTRQSKERLRSNLLILVTPHIIMPGEEEENL